MAKCGHLTRGRRRALKPDFSSANSASPAAGQSEEREDRCRRIGSSPVTNGADTDAAALAVPIAGNKGNGNGATSVAPHLLSPWQRTVRSLARRKRLANLGPTSGHFFRLIVGV